MTPQIPLKCDIEDDTRESCGNGIVVMVTRIYTCDEIAYNYTYTRLCACTTGEI